MNDFGIKLCTLYQKTSKNGNTYFFGRMGNTKLSLLLDMRNTEEGKDPVWNLMIQECDWKPEQQSQPKPFAQIRTPAQPEEDAPRRARGRPRKQPAAPPTADQKSAAFAAFAPDDLPSGWGAQ